MKLHGHEYPLKSNGYIRNEMTLEIWTMIGIGVAIVALILTQTCHSNRLIHDRLQSMETHMNDGFQSMETQIVALRERMAHLEGLLEGLREAISGRRAA